MEKNSTFKIALNEFFMNVVKKNETNIKSNLLEMRNYISINDFTDFFEKSFVTRKLKFPNIINYASDYTTSLKAIKNIITKQSIKIGLGKAIFKIKENVKKSDINYKFDLSDIKKFKLIPKIKIEKEIFNTLSILNNKINGQK